MHVQSQPVQGATARDAHTDGTDLAGHRARRIDPHARVAVETPRRNRQVRQRVDHNLLDGVHVARDRARRGGDADDGIGDELSRAVVGDVPAPVAAHDLGAHGAGVDEHVGPIGVDPQREHVRVLEQEEMVVTTVVVHGALQGVRLGIRDPAQPANPEHVDFVPALVPAQSSAAQSWVPRISVIRATKAAAYAPSTAR